MLQPDKADRFEIKLDDGSLSHCSLEQLEAGDIFRVVTANGSPVKIGEEKEFVFRKNMLEIRLSSCGSPWRFVVNGNGIRDIFTKTITEYGERFSLEEWTQEVADGMFNPDDGDGYWAKGDRMSGVYCFDTPPPGADSVIWFNK